MAKDSYRRVKDRAATGCCPACGQNVPDAQLRVDLQTNTISANGLMVIVQPRTAELVTVLLEKFPNFVPREIIISKVWANNALARMVDAQATRARMALRKLGYDIESIRHSGYRISKERPTARSVSPAVASFSRLQYVRAF